MTGDIQGSEGRSTSGGAETRRSILRKGGLVGLGVWAAPVVTSLATPAVAGTGSPPPAGCCTGSFVAYLPLADVQGVLAVGEYAQIPGDDYCLAGGHGLAGVSAPDCSPSSGRVSAKRVGNRIDICLTSPETCAFPSTGYSVLVRYNEGLPVPDSNPCGSFYLGESAAERACISLTDFDGSQFDEYGYDWPDRPIVAVALAITCRCPD